MKFFLVFHHNLAFSSIPKEHYPYLIDRVYSRLLDLVDEGFSLGLEFTGETLEIISRLRPQYIDRLRENWLSSRCEVVGSSYSQAIFPLIPAEVNRWNLDFGIAVYRRLFGRGPEIFYLNEQVYSESMPELYRQAGAGALMLDWMSACKGNNWPGDYRYQVVRHEPSGLKLLWADSIAFQRLQRTVWGDISLDEYFAFLAKHGDYGDRLAGDDACLCLYASDAEVFDYFPGRLLTHGAEKGHFSRLLEILQRLCDECGNLVLPGNIAAGRNCPCVASVATADYPVRTKKQDKYNVLRWAVTGRQASRMNTQCHHLFRLLQKQGEGSQRLLELRRELVSLWGSDFRTHTTDEKYEHFHNRMGRALAAAGASFGLETIEDASVVRWMLLGRKVGHAGEWTVKRRGRRLEMDAFRHKLVLLTNKGLAVDSLALDGIPVAGTIAHGHFTDISLGSDFFSGHLVLLTQDGRQQTDLSCPVGEVEVCRKADGVLLRNRQPLELPGLTIQKTFRLDNRGMTLVYDMYARELRPASLRLGIWTLLPEAFEQKTLGFAVHQGGGEEESYLFSGNRVEQDMPVNQVVTARHSLGNTTGRLHLFDADKALLIETTAAELYSVPLLHYETAQAWNGTESFFARVYYTICERDDVANVFWNGHHRVSFRLSRSGKRYL